MRNKFFISALFIILISVFVFISCQKNASVEITTTETLSPFNKKYQVVETLPVLTVIDTFVWHHHGIYTMVTFEADNDEASETANENISDAEKGNQITATCSDAFSGSARKTAKTSFATPTAFAGYVNVNALRVSLPTDTYMRTLGITNSSPRVAQENYNESVTVSYLYAIARESDNDFHMIIGDNNPIADNLINCEASGNPSSKAASYKAINAVRMYLKNYFGTNFCGASGYTKFTPAIPVILLKGSLFFDIDHAAGTIGPTGLRPNTAWEMHPVQSISF